MTLKLLHVSGHLSTEHTRFEMKIDFTTSHDKVPDDYYCGFILVKVITVFDYQNVQ